MSLCVTAAVGLWALSARDRSAPSPPPIPIASSPPRTRGGDSTRDPGSGDSAESVDVIAPRDTAAGLQFAGPVDVGVDRKIAVLEIRTRDFRGHELNRSAAAVAGGHWVALPTRLLIGASEVVASRSVGNANAIDVGTWDRDAEVALWRTQDPVDSAELLRWQADRPVTLLSFRSGESLELGLVSGRPDGDLFRFPRPADASAGVLVQDGGVVGWIFPESLSVDGWLCGADPEELDARTPLDTFYRRTFAGGRAEAIAFALAEDDALTQAKQLIEAFDREPILEADDVPACWADDVAKTRLVERLVTLRDGAQRHEAADLLDDRVIERLDDERVLVIAVQSVGLEYGDEPAIQLAERWWQALVTPDSESDRELYRIVPMYYGNWLFTLLEGREFAAAWQVHDRGLAAFPDDANLYLRGVELDLADRDWRAAEARLDARTYPAAFDDRVTLLRQRISELKGLAGKIVLRFTPGASQVVVPCLLNDRYTQDFILDTGATTTMIPLSAIRGLGIVIPRDAPRRQVRTAGGDVEVAEIVLDSIAIGSWPVRDVRVLVHDLPGFESYGLLGINFLNHFKIEMNTEQGRVVLEPK